MEAGAVKKNMPKLSCALAGLVVLASLAWKLTPLPDARARLGIVAASQGQRLRVLPLAPWELEYFGKAQATRWLASDNISAMVVTVVDGSGNRGAVHDPGFCFRGAGWSVVDESEMILPHGTAKRVLLRREKEDMEALYWFSDGQHAHGSAVRYWIDATVRRLTLGTSGAEPVLVLVVPAQRVSGDWSEWLRRWPALTRL